MKAPLSNGEEHHLPLLEKGDLYNNNRKTELSNVMLFRIRDEINGRMIENI